MKIKKGDFVARKSYKKDILFIVDKVIQLSNGKSYVILKGVTIGDNCVIGAGCVIHKDVPPNSIVVNKQKLVLNQNSIS